MSEYARKNGNRIYLVGDPKQAIYRFRGGDLCTFLRVRDKFQKDTQRCSYEPMNCNYRSSREINEALNQFFRSDCKYPWFRTETVLDDEQVNNLNIYQEQEIRYENIETGTKTRWLESSNRKNSIQLINICETKNQPAKFRKAYFEQIAIEITKLINSSPQYYDRDGAVRSLSASDICCLVRNKNEGSKLETFLKHWRIPCAIYKKSNLFESLEALYVEQLLLLAANPQDHAARKRVMLSPVFMVITEITKDLIQCSSILNLNNASFVGIKALVEGFGVVCCLQC